MASEISSKYDLPTAYAAKVMGQLAKARIFQSDRGPTGGFRLARPPKDITALEVFEAMNGPLASGRILPEGATRNQQRGVTSRAYEPGPLSTYKEYNVESFLQWYVKRLGEAVEERE